MATETTPKRRICAGCKRDITEQIRAKDSAGRYFCESCRRKKVVAQPASTVEVVNTLGGKKIDYPCEHCGVRIVSGWKLAGCVDTCPACNRECRVPVPNIKYKCPSCFVLLENPGSMGDREDNCPHCGAEHIVPPSMQQVAETELEEQLEVRAAREQRKHDRANKIVLADSEIKSIAKPIRSNTLEVSSLFLTLFGAVGVIIWGFTFFRPNSSLTEVAEALGLWFLALLLFAFVIDGARSYCPNCKHVLRRKEIDAQLLDSRMDVETRMRTDVHYDRNWRQIGHTNRQEQVFVRVNTVQRWYECQDCGHQWNVVRREKS